MPHLCKDPIVAAGHILGGIQTYSARFVNPKDPVVISVTKIQAGSDAYNVIPRTCSLGGTFRCFSHELRNTIPKQLTETIQNIAAGFGVKATVKFNEKGFPPTINHERQARKAYRAAIKTVGESSVTQSCAPSMGAEDFSQMLEKREGCYVFLGAGENYSPLHHPKYDFNDDLLPVGAELFVNMAMESLEEDIQISS